MSAQKGGSIDRRKRARPSSDESGRRLVLGQQPVREVLRVWGKTTFEVVVLDKGKRSPSLIQYAQDQGVKVRSVDRVELDRLSGGGFHQGALAYAPPLRLVPWDSLLQLDKLLAVALDGVIDPQNFGAVVRSAVGIAGAPIIWGESASAPLTPATFRASAGAIEHAVLCRVPSLHGALNEARAAGVEVIGLCPDGTTRLQEAKADRPTIIVIGSEEKGMTRSVRKACTSLARLEQSGRVQSLNASVAAGISIYTINNLRLTSNG